MHTARSIAWLFLGLTLVVLIFEALHPAWSYHLRVDADGFYYSRATYFLTHHNLTGLGYNEYQPGAVAFFIALSPALLLSDSRDMYVAALIVMNVLLSLALAGLYKRTTGSDLAVALFAALLLFTGPIVLYRFDLLVGLFMVGAIYCWQKDRPYTAMLLLSSATVMKIYPAFLVPYFLWLAYRQQGWERAFQYVAVFTLGVAGLIAAYAIAFTVPPSQLVADLSIHSLKPVHAESVWATALGWWSKLTTGEFARGQGAFGIFGIDPAAVIGPIGFYNYFWIVPLGLFYGWLFRRAKPHALFDPAICLLIVLLFLIFSKILTPQYLLWFMFFIPLLPAAVQLRPPALVLVTLVLLVTFLSQYLYPLSYNDLLGGFYTTGQPVWLFIVLTIRNILLIATFIVGLKMATKRAAYTA